MLGNEVFVGTFYNTNEVIALYDTVRRAALGLGQTLITPHAERKRSLRTSYSVNFMCVETVKRYTC